MPPMSIYRHVKMSCNILSNDRVFLLKEEESQFFKKFSISIFIKYMHSYFLKDVASKPEFSHVNSLLFVDDSVEWECFSKEKKKSSIKLTWKMS